ncbi:penicillin acylase family protein [Cesiribacter andamanensis]|uniref:Acyl-homoserine lactone acylase quiP n=1 Tax=Cesiribacter andamanensis AMV16 TaxID=1279009 RepID=M7NHA2_9BACT|nr:penicillin acylase family protein [Cesiribacter andamanensis]EMR01185.1 Acyl-homoserine lactone acylase quiP precursor [Cesiribacter andamanensis AMV16]
MRLLLTFIGTVLLIMALDNRLGQLPPLGRFLDPLNGFYQNAATPYSSRDSETFYFDQLKGEAAVAFDEFMVPHIKASTPYDLYFLQGYVTARHRLWQMEVQTHFAAGRLSEIFGENMLEADRLTRRKGLLTGAKEALAAMQRDPETAEVVQAYADGVNAYLSRLKYRHKPFEYKLLGYDPEAWTPLKSALLLMYMAEDLAGYDVDLENTNLLRLLGREDFNLLYPDRLPGEDPVAPSGTRWNFGAVPLQERPLSYPDIAITDTLPKPNPANGSNNWAVSGSKTASGRPILSNDPHLSLNLPSVWYAIQLQGPQVNVYGVTLPGAPGVIIGFNDSIAWGVTNATRDVKDWYRIQFRDSSRQEYAFDGGWQKSEKVVERFALRPSWFWQGEGEYLDTVLYTRHGPVVYDRNFTKSSEEQNFAMRWVAHQPGNSLKAFLLLNQARNYQDYAQALNHYQTPGQNFVFASVSGDIALRVQGRYPAKWQDQGRFLMDGSRSDFEWQAFIPNEQNVLVRNPERGFVSSANQIPADSSYPYYIYDQTYEHYRNRRINQQLQAMQNISPQDMMRLQTDNYHLQAAETLPWMLRGLNLQLLRPEERRAAEVLRSWNFEALAELEAPAIYQSWWTTLKNLTFDELDSLEVAVIQPSNAAMANLLQHHPNHPLLDISYTPERERLPELLMRSFRETVKELAEWEQTHEKSLSWGNYKNSSIRHLTGQEALSFSGLQIHGGRGIVNANSGRHGASWRMVVALGSPIEAWGIYPGGQSGNPGSPYYANFLESWRKGEYNRLYFITEQTPFADKILFTHTFTPPAAQ